MNGSKVTLTIRMIMSGKEVGSIIGKGGEIINSIREESGAKIHISDGSVPERIVTVTGSTDAILKSFGLIAKKFEEDGPEKNGNLFFVLLSPFPISTLKWIFIAEVPLGLLVSYCL